MLNAAVAFYLAAARCRPPVPVNPTKWYATHAPPIVCYALSIELYLKLLILLTTGREARGHDLAELYSQLDHQTRQTVIGGSKYPGDPDHLQSLIDEASQAFVLWRYAHEHELLVASPDHLEAIADALHLAVKVVKPDLVSVYG